MKIIISLIKRVTESCKEMFVRAIIAFLHEKVAQRTVL